MELFSMAHDLLSQATFGPEAFTEGRPCRGRGGAGVGIKGKFVKFKHTIKYPGLQSFCADIFLEKGEKKGGGYNFLKK